MIEGATTNEARGSMAGAAAPPAIRSGRNHVPGEIGIWLFVAGDLLVFVDEDQISALERDMEESGVLEGSRMAMAFNMLRSNDLIWSYVVNNYLKGQPPSAFDLLHWNSDATRMPAANHSYYLRNCYLDNRLSTGSMVLENTLLDLSRVKVPVYNLATREDHIAPAESVLYGSQFFGGPVKFVLSGSGHIAGVVNPPAGGKYQYWTNDDIKAASVAEWMKGAVEHKGSWWPEWKKWIAEFEGRRVIIADLKGLRDIRRLLEVSGQEIHCLDLAEREAAVPGGDAMLDQKARNALKTRMRDLQEDLAEAEGMNDIGRAERLRTEIDSLLDTLKAALGLGGRSRRLGDAAEKARTAVTWRIRHALTRITQAHPELGRHLAHSLRTGTFCSYQPETSIAWRFSDAPTPVHQRGL